MESTGPRSVTKVLLESEETGSAGSVESDGEVWLTCFDSVGAGCMGVRCVGAGCAGAGCVGAGCVGAGCAGAGCAGAGCAGAGCAGAARPQRMCRPIRR